MKMKQTECRNSKIHLDPSIQTCACFFVQCIYRQFLSCGWVLFLNLLHNLKSTKVGIDPPCLIYHTSLVMYKF